MFKIIVLSYFIIAGVYASIAYYQLYKMVKNMDEYNLGFKELSQMMGIEEDVNPDYISFYEDGMNAADKDINVMFLAHAALAIMWPVALFLYLKCFKKKN